MALQLNTTYETPHGITLNSTYWRWVSMGLDVPGMTAHVVLYAYTNEAAFNEGKQPIGQRAYTVTGLEFGALVMSPPQGQTISDVISAAVYAYVVATDADFSEAVNV